jgi:serine/threonine-protein kinase
MEMILHHVQTPPPPPQKVRPDLNLPPAVSGLLMRALQKEPGRRFRTAEEMAGALEALTVLPATAVSPRPGATVRGAAPARASTAIEVEPILTPEPRPRTAPTRLRPPAPEEEDEAPSRSSAAVMAGSALIILTVVGAVAWRSKARTRPVEALAPPAVEAPGLAAPVPLEGAPAAVPAASDSDARIQNEIQRLLVSSSALRSQPIVVEVANGIVTLSGSVGDTVSSQLAESFASSVSGVRRVFNTLRVPAAPPAVAAAAPPPAPAAGETASEDTSRRPPRDDGERDREAARDLMAKAKREMEAGNTAAAVAACQEVLRIDPNHPHARDCIERGSRRGGPPRRQ